MNSREKTIRAILVKPGMDPEICELPVAADEQQEAIADLLVGNFGATEFFDLQNGASLFILTNDLSIPLGMPANRRFPGDDSDAILFGNAIFIAAYNDNSELEGTVDMPEHICKMFIEQIKLNFLPCNGDEKPDSQAEVYVENAGTAEERAYKWQEVLPPADAVNCKSLQVGRARWLANDDGEVLEINGRYFKQINVITSKTPLN